MLDGTVPAAGSPLSATLAEVMPWVDRCCNGALAPQLLIGGAATMVGVALVALTEKRARAEEALAETA